VKAAATFSTRYTQNKAPGAANTVQTRVNRRKTPPTQARSARAIYDFGARSLHRALPKSGRSATRKA
jgi:hypothetical protein